MTNTKKIKDGKIRDIDIRLAFMQRNMKFFEREGTEFVNEFGVNSTNVVDLACFDFQKKLFYGFEIKSEQDNTERLRKQLNAYITFFNIVYVITHCKHTEKVLAIIDKERQFNKVGVIEVDSNLTFNQIRAAKLYKPVYWLFIQNLDLDELRLLSANHDLPLEGNKQTLLGRLRKCVKEDEIYEGLNNKLHKYYLRKCPSCGSKLYYNKTGRSGTLHVCYKCGKQMY